MGIIAFLVLGLLVGAIAKALMPGDDGGGIILTMVLGVVGAFLGGFLGSLIFDVSMVDGFFEISTWVAAIVGSMIVLGIYRAVTGSGDRHRDVI
jgi:uncharacterized membrane protein YeaQ/YmgE (transglycosylase-associated protein family)